METTKYKIYIAPKCEITKDDEEVLKSIYHNSELISWFKFSHALKKIEDDLFHIRTQTEWSENCQPLLSNGTRASCGEPSERKDYLHKDGLLITYTDLNNHDSKFSLIYMLKIYGKDKESIDKLANEVGLRNSLEKDLSS